MNSKERVKTVFDFEVPDKVPIWEWIFWPETVQRWENEGLPKGVDLEDYFNFDIRVTYFNKTLLFEEKIIDKSANYVIKRDSYGVTQKILKNRSGAPQLLDSMIKTKEDWLKHKERIVADVSRINEPTWFSSKDIGSLAENKGFHKDRRYVFFYAAEPCWEGYNILGAKEWLIKMKEDPDLIKDIAQTYTNLIIEMYELMVTEGFLFDGVLLAGDLCYKKGMLFSPRIYRELFSPYDKKLCQFFKEKKIPIMMHCDGNVHQLIPLLLESGFRGIHPLDVGAGMDVRKLKGKYTGKMVLIGNISPTLMGNSKKEIEKEIRDKILIAKEGGGYIYHSDHSIPPTVSLENYRFTLETVSKYGTYNI